MKGEEERSTKDERKNLLPFTNIHGRTKGNPGGVLKKEVLMQ
jgi:hypothetical protein